MARVTGTYRTSVVGGETVKAFIPHPLPPANPPLRIEGELAALHEEALAALGRLGVAAAMVPSANWFLYGFLRKEAVISSQIEGTQATLMDVVAYEAAPKAQSHAIKQRRKAWRAEKIGNADSHLETRADGLEELNSDQ